MKKHNHFPRYCAGISPHSTLQLSDYHIDDSATTQLAGGHFQHTTECGIFAHDDFRAGVGWALLCSRIDYVRKYSDYHFPHESTSVIIIAAQSWGGAHPTHMGMYFSGVTAITFISLSGGSR